jgi:hypothetical protein
MLLLLLLLIISIIIVFVVTIVVVVVFLRRTYHLSTDFVLVTVVRHNLKVWHLRYVCNG